MTSAKRGSFRRRARWPRTPEHLSTDVADVIVDEAEPSGPLTAPGIRGLAWESRRERK